MLNLLIGIALGAAFSPFWIMLWNKGKELISSSTKK